MLQRKAYRFRLEPDVDRQMILARFAGSCRFIWNRALAEQKSRLARGEGTAGYAEMCRWLTGWRHAEETAWLAEIHVHPLQQKLKDLDRALRDSFRPQDDTGRKRFPRFKNKNHGDSFRYPISVKVIAVREGWGRVWLPKIGWLKYRASRPVEGTIAQATVSEKAQHWFISIQTEREVADPVRSEAPAIGIDRGASCFAAGSEGTMFQPPDSFERIEHRLSHAQRALARKQRGSANWHKQKKQVTRLLVREANARRDYLHKTSTTIAKNHGVVVLEGLPTRQGSRAPDSAAPAPVTAPGGAVPAKRRLSRPVLSQGWFAFRTMLGWKLSERGGQLILLASHDIRRQCSVCGHVTLGNHEAQTTFTCAQCGNTQSADCNAARNILNAAGHVAYACGGIPPRRPGETGTDQTAA
ncbi:MAG: transposase [Azospirillaceae bacterium]|nr:transposase [Azospirillaceae bacterium]